MAVRIPLTEFNERLSEFIRSRISADRFYIAGRAAFWRLIGLGIVAFSIGAAIGIVFYGYSYIVDNSSSLTLFSSEFSKALSTTELRASAEGVVQVEPHEISLAKGQTITFDSNSRMLLDPAANIQVGGEIQVQAPSISVPQNSSPRALPRTPTITNFTVFKRVPLGNGSVMTGWKFLTSIQKIPSNQYCYYTKNSDISDVDIVLDIAENEKMETPKTMPKGFDILAAFNRCVWFKGENHDR
jgi:hypothetical protein